MKIFLKKYNFIIVLLKKANTVTADFKIAIFSFFPIVLFSFWLPRSNIKKQLILEYFLQRCPKDCTKISLQRLDLLHIELELQGLNYQTPFMRTVS